MKTKWREIIIVVIALLLISLVISGFASWDNTKPGDADAIYTWPASIRDNWDAIEAVFGEDLVDASVGVIDVFNVKNPAYGAVGNGIIDDSAAIQTAIDAIKVVGAGTLYFPTGLYKVNTTLDCTGFLGIVGNVYRGINIIGASMNGSRIMGSTSGTPIFDFTESGYCSIEHLRITGDSSNTPNVAILLARSTGAATAGMHNFRRILVEGYFTKGGIYSFASEENHYDNIRVVINGGGATWCMALSNTNFESISSPYKTILDTGAPMTRTTFISPQFIMETNPATGTCLYLYGRVEDLECYGAYMYSEAQSYIKMYSPSGTESVFRIGFHNLRAEGKGSTSKPDYGLFMTGASTGSFIQIVVDNVWIDAYIYEIYQDNTVSGSFSGVIDGLRGNYGLEMRFNIVGSSRINVHIGDLTVDTSISGSEITNYYTGTISLANKEAVILRDFYTRIFQTTLLRRVGNIGTLADDATPSVGLGNLFITGGTTTITDFDDGVEGQIITIIGQHTLTITDGTNIILDGGANMSMTSGDTLMLVQLADTYWYQLSEANNN